MAVFLTSFFDTIIIHRGLGAQGGGSFFRREFHRKFGRKFCAPARYFFFPSHLHRLFFCAHQLPLTHFFVCPFPTDSPPYGDILLFFSLIHANSSLGQVTSRHTDSVSATSLHAPKDEYLYLCAILAPTLGNWAHFIVTIPQGHCSSAEMVIAATAAPNSRRSVWAQCAALYLYSTTTSACIDAREVIIH